MNIRQVIQAAVVKNNKACMKRNESTCFLWQSPRGTGTDIGRGSLIVHCEREDQSMSSFFSPGACDAIPEKKKSF